MIILQILTSFRFGNVPTVTLLVGENKTPYHVHMNLLCDASSFFKAAFTSQFREGSEKKMDLPEEDQDMFDSFVQWLYYRHYEIPRSQEDELKDGGRFMQTMKLYVFADKYDISSLRSLIVEKLFAVDKSGGVLSLKAVAYLYEYTSPNASMRKLVADWYAGSYISSWYQGDRIREWFRQHPDIVTDIAISSAKALSRVVQLDPFTTGNMPEEYKDQGKAEPAASVKKSRTT